MLTVYEIYASIQGESTYAGLRCAFVRLAACDLRCVWCDTPYAFTGGRKMPLEDVVAAVDALGCPMVELTGGEPLLQAEAPQLMSVLLERGYTVLLETGGHLPLDDVPDDVRAIVDVKCPGSGESSKMHWENLDQLSAHDEVKFVIADRADFDYAAGVTRRYGLAGKVAAVLFSPVHGVLAPDELARWMIADRSPARLQLQAHKYIWDPETRGV
jgi:7-carboxy-7-deazaguanine synthase